MHGISCQQQKPKKTYNFNNSILRNVYSFQLYPNLLPTDFHIMFRYKKNTRNIIIKNLKSLKIKYISYGTQKKV